MKVYMQINLEIPFDDEETQELERLFSNGEETFEDYLSEQVGKILIHEADIPEEAIKSIVTTVKKEDV